MTSEPRSWLGRHRVLALIGVNTALLLLFGSCAELALRIAVPYNPGYYTAVEAHDTELVHPYGVIKVNRFGYPDDEFELSKPRRVGYFGDSVTYGVGAGYGYRISEHLEQAYPELEHLNLGGIGLSVFDAEIEHSAKLAERFGLTDAIYLFNLNDILPDQVVGEAPPPASWRLRDTIINHLDWLRGRSYLYTFLRKQAKTVLAGFGVGFHGYSAFELEPSANEAVLAETAARINHFYRRLGELGVTLRVVILPYEMQISDEAAETYAAAGIHWEPEFIDRSAQRIIMKHLAPEVPVFDAYYAFVASDETSAAERAQNGLGQYFVYDRGDSLDWNHPNREGHRKIADYLVRERILDAPPSEQSARATHAARPDQGAR